MVSGFAVAGRKCFSFLLVSSLLSTICFPVYGRESKFIFHQFAAAYIHPGNIWMDPLPVMFANLRAFKKNNGVEIEWSNLTEQKIVQYLVERSADGANFHLIGTNRPANNSNDRGDYRFFDASALHGMNYYRICAEDIDGYKVYSLIMRVKTGGVGIVIFPNPVKEKQFMINFPVMLRGDYSLEMINSIGQITYSRQVEIRGPYQNEQVRLPANHERGIYTIRISGNGFENKMTVYIQ